MPVLRNVSRDLQARRTSCLDKLADLSAGLQVDWHAKITTKICKNFNESWTPHICWLQISYLEYEQWGFPRVQLYYSKLVSRRRKRPVTETSDQSTVNLPQNEIHNIRVWTSVGKNKMIIGYMDLKNKTVSYYISVLTYRSGTCKYTLQIIHFTVHTLHFTETLSSNATRKWSTLFTNLHKLTYKK
jgi:hypothetical protein